MAAITEDYISFEVAKLLKKKGFKEECLRFYMPNGHGMWKYEYYHNDRIECPTIQMTMKWLREVHKIYIDIDIRIILEQWSGYNINIYKTNTNNCLLDKVISLKNLKDNTSYEKASEAGIKYALENLI